MALDHLDHLDHKVAVVTGATRGIGRAVAERLGRDGAAVVVNYRAERDGASAAAETLVDDIVSAGGRAIAAAGDVSRQADVKALLDAGEKEFGGVDIIVNNAGVFSAAPVEYTSEQEFDRLISVNLKSVFFAGQEAVHRLRDGGRVINISAVVPNGGIAYMGAYAATKAAVDVLTRSLAHRLGGRSITVNAVAPGTTDTEMLSQDARDMVDQITAATPLGRLGTAQDIADVVAFLAGDDARWITGQVIAAGGGLE